MQRAFVRWISRRVGRMRRERLERHMRGPLRRRIVLGSMFRAMPRVVRRKALDREDVVVEWRIAGRRDGGEDVRALVISGGVAKVEPGAAQDPDLVVTVGAVDLLLLGTGNASGPALFVRGDLAIEGDPWLAMRLPRIFAAGRQAGARRQAPSP